MKNIILFSALILGMIFAARDRDQTAMKINGRTADAAAPAPAPDSTIETKPHPLKLVDRALFVFSERLRRTEHELQSSGFPKVLMDERLSETERAEILEKVQIASALQNQIAMLKIKKIDLEAERGTWEN